jgi:hypothetical protein
MDIAREFHEPNLMVNWRAQVVRWLCAGRESRNAVSALPCLLAFERRTHPQARGALHNLGNAAELGASTSRPSMFGRANAGYFIQALEVLAQHANGPINPFFPVFVESSEQDDLRECPYRPQHGVMRVFAGGGQNAFSEIQRELDVLMHSLIHAAHWSPRSSGARFRGKLNRPVEAFWCHELACGAGMRNAVPQLSLLCQARGQRSTASYRLHSMQPST